MVVPLEQAVDSEMQLGAETFKLVSAWKPTPPGLQQVALASGVTTGQLVAVTEYWAPKHWEGRVAAAAGDARLSMMTGATHAVAPTAAAR
jgi:hypothetical protein